MDWHNAFDVANQLARRVAATTDPELAVETTKWRRRDFHNGRSRNRVQGFKSVGSVQRFLSVHAAVHNTFNVQRHLASARTHRAFRASAMQTWHEVVAAA
jgi:putative transposase